MVREALRMLARASPEANLTSGELLSRSASSTPLGGRGASESSESFSSSSSWMGDDGDRRVLERREAGL